jgi:hypothetical protein
LRHFQARRETRHLTEHAEADRRDHVLERRGTISRRFTEAGFVAQNGEIAGALDLDQILVQPDARAAAGNTIGAIRGTLPRLFAGDAKFPRSIVPGAAGMRHLAPCNA